MLDPERRPRMPGHSNQRISGIIRLFSYRLGASEIYLEAQVQAQGFYEKLGFTVCSDEFDDAGIPHIAMRRVIG